MTDLIKTYAKPAIAKAVATKAGRDNATIMYKGGIAAIVDKPRNRSQRIETPQPNTAREYVWQQCNARLAAGEDYKTLRRNVIFQGVDDGYHIPQLQTEVSRWRHRFS